MPLRSPPKIQPHSPRSTPTSPSKKPLSAGPRSGEPRKPGSTSLLLTYDNIAHALQPAPPSSEWTQPLGDVLAILSPTKAKRPEWDQAREIPWNPAEAEDPATLGLCNGPAFRDAAAAAPKWNTTSNSSGASGGAHGASYAPTPIQQSSSVYLNKALRWSTTGKLLQEKARVDTELARAHG